MGWESCPFPLLVKDLKTSSSAANINRDINERCRLDREVRTTWKESTAVSPVGEIKRAAQLRRTPPGTMRSVLHCNRFQMVLETKADSEHQKKSVNLGLRTKKLELSKRRCRWMEGLHPTERCFREWYSAGEAVSVFHLYLWNPLVVLHRLAVCWPVKYTSHPKNTDFKWC